MNANLRQRALMLLVSREKATVAIRRYTQLYFLKPFSEFAIRHTKYLRAARKEHYDLIAAKLKQESEELLPRFQRKNTAPVIDPTGLTPTDVEAQRVALLARCKSYVAEVKALPPIASPYVPVAVLLLQTHLRWGTRCQYRLRSIQQLRDELDSPHFFSKLILLLILPACSADSQLGDLEEEFRELTLRTGEAAARQWYLRQTVGSIANALWDKVTKLAALVTIGEAIHRLIRPNR